MFRARLINKKMSVLHGHFHFMTRLTGLFLPLFGFAEHADNFVKFGE